MSEENKKNILVVEDDKVLRDALVDKLTSEGFNVLQARHGEEGLSIALDKKPDLILLDIIMPIMDGITMLKKLRESGEWGANAAVISLTNLGTPEDVSKMVEAGVTNYLVKSNWKLSEITEKVRSVLE